MVDTKITAYTEDTAPASDSMVETVDDPGGTPVNRKTSFANWVKGMMFGNATSKAAPVAEDIAAFADSEASNVAKSATWAVLNPAINSQLTANAETASFTFALTDRGKVTTISNAGATTATVPPNATIAFPTGTILILCQIGAGACTWTAGAGVTLNINANYTAVTNGQYSYSFARKTATNTWEVGGGLVPLNPTESWSFALGDESTSLTASTSVAKLTWYTPYAITLTGIKGMVTVAPTDATLIMDVHEAGTTIMATNKVDILTTALTDDGTATLSDTSLAADAKMEFFVDQIGSTIAGAGAKITLIGRRT